MREDSKSEDVGITKIAKLLIRKDRGKSSVLTKSESSQHEKSKARSDKLIKLYVIIFIIICAVIVLLQIY